MTDKKYSKTIAQTVRRKGQTIAKPLFGHPAGVTRPIKLGPPRPSVGSIIEISHKESKNSQTTVTGWTTLAKANSPTAALYKILHRFKANPCYPISVEQEVAAWQQAPGIDDPLLVDMTELPFVTIDNDDSRDLDQAIQIDKNQQSKEYIVRYALADASYYVRPNTALFEEALDRGASYYLPRLCVPMLPAELSEGLVSLNPGVKRRAVVFVMQLDKLGRPMDTRLVRARIRSRAKLSYNGVQEYHDNPESSPLNNQEYTDTLNLLKEVGNLRIADAIKRDVVRFNRKEITVDYSDTKKNKFVIASEERNDVSLWNEQISLLCNTEGARLLHERHSNSSLQAIFRVHSSPAEEARNQLAITIENIVKIHKLDPEIWSWKNEGGTDPGGETMAEYLNRLSKTEGQSRLYDTIERQILLTNQRSMFTSEPGLHFALAVNPYCRFSSPMREIVGIFTHKEAQEIFFSNTSQSSVDNEEQLRDQVILSANRSKERQRQITKEVSQLAVEHFLKPDLTLPLSKRPIYTGTILGMRSSRLYVRLDEPPIELKVFVKDIESQTGHSFVLTKNNTVLRSSKAAFVHQFKIGDQIRLRVSKQDKKKKRWVIVPVI
jgi:ribonuclease R